MKEDCKEHSGIVNSIDNLKKSDEKQWAAIEKLQNRLPIWATIVISILSATTTWALTYANFAMKI